MRSFICGSSKQKWLPSLHEKMSVHFHQIISMKTKLIAKEILKLNWFSEFSALKKAILKYTRLWDTCKQPEINEQHNLKNINKSDSFERISEYILKIWCFYPPSSFKVWSIDQWKGSVLVNSGKFSQNWFHKPWGKVN